MKQQILEAIKENKLILFIGAGLSQPAGFPNWNELISLVLIKLAEEDEKYNILNDALKAGLFTTLEVLEKIKDKKKQVYEIMDREIDKSLEGIDLELHRKLGKISSKIITTNYDRLLENATTFKKVVFDNTFHIAKLHDKENFLLKLHGCIENPEKCILFQQDYDQLYNETAAIEKLNSLVADHTILFIGFSLSDEYVKKQFEHIYKIYRGFSKQHFYFTVDSSANEIHGVKPIILEKWSELAPYLDSLIEMKTATTQVSVAVTSVADKELMSSFSKDKQVTIALLMATPIDQENMLSFDKVYKHLTKFKIFVECFYFSIEALRSLDNFDYVIILSKTVKGKLLIEDQYLKSKLITLEEIEDNLISNDLKGMIILTDKQVQQNESSITLPLAVLWEDDLGSVFFKLFQKKSLDKFMNGFVLNSDEFDLTVVEKGVSKIITRSDLTKLSLSDNIDSKNLVNFVGRKTDLEDIVRKIINTSKQVLTIKGSGGIGKTTTVKKVAMELYIRGNYPDGIFFIDCEFITNYKSFEYKVAQCFAIESTINLKDHILQNNIELDAMIIMDNFEPLLYIDDSDEIKSLLAFICDHANIVITSREWVKLEFEERHELRAFTNEEAYQLFRKYYKSELTPDETKILKDDILGTLLNNNPLAIKIIARNLPKSKNMNALKIELEKDFFNITKDGYENIFDDEVDANIERSKSMYQSIAYSYNSLKPNEKLLFELLSLFPDGIHMNNMKTFFSEGKYKLDSKKITDREFNSLENKSLIEINRGFIELQSIIGRFSEHQFLKREEEEKVDFYQRAFYYMNSLIKIISDIQKDENAVGLEVFDQNIENFIKSFDYLTKLKEPQVNVISYITKISYSFDLIEQNLRFHRELEKIKHHFDVEKSDILIGALIAASKYHEGEFEKSYEQIKKIFPIKDFYLLDYTNELESNIIIFAFSIYRYSNVNEVRQFLIKSNYYHHEIVESMLFYAGEYKRFESLSEHSEKMDFFNMEVKFNSNKLDYSELESYIDKLHRKQYTELMQTHYIKAKMGIIDNKTINKLVVINPYTSGIKSLMLAFIEKDIDKANSLYKQAINDLQPIRYYYTEAIYFYSKFLVEHGLNENSDWINKGLLLASENHYSFLHHKFMCLVEGVDTPYDEFKYKMPVEYQLDELIEKNVKV